MTDVAVCDGGAGYHHTPGIGGIVDPTRRQAVSEYDNACLAVAAKRDEAILNSLQKHRDGSGHPDGLNIAGITEATGLPRSTVVRGVRSLLKAKKIRIVPISAKLEIYKAVGV